MTYDGRCPDDLGTGQTPESTIGPTLRNPQRQLMERAKGHRGQHCENTKRTIGNGGHPLTIDKSDPGDVDDLVDNRTVRQNVLVKGEEELPSASTRWFLVCSSILSRNDHQSAPELSCDCHTEEPQQYYKHH